MVIGLSGHPGKTEFNKWGALGNRALYIDKAVQKFTSLFSHLR
jgi:hypothetical protein